MTTVWRIELADRFNTIHRGFPGLEAEGRWHVQGLLPCTYASSSLSLAILEKLVQYSSSARSLAEISANLVIIKIELAKEPLVLEKSRLKAGWGSASSYTEQTKILGLEFLVESRNTAMLVPSVIVPEEYNVLINCSENVIGKVLSTNKSKVKLQNATFEIHRTSVFDPRISKILS